MQKVARPPGVETKKKRKVYPLIEWTTKRIIAFPVHSPGHWTLGITVNHAWGTGNKAEWVIFHFDSFPFEGSSKSTAQKIGQFVTNVHHRKDIPIKSIPVPGQKTNTNDCALWPAHYLKIFLKDPDFFIEHCNSVCGSSFFRHTCSLIPQDLTKVSRHSKDNRRLWEADSGSRLRAASVQLFDFYAGLWEAARDECS